MSVNIPNFRWYTINRYFEYFIDVILRLFLIKNTGRYIFWGLIYLTSYETFKIIKLHWQNSTKYTYPVFNLQNYTFVYITQFKTHIKLQVNKWTDKYFFCTTLYKSLYSFCLLGVHAKDKKFGKQGYIC